MTTECALDDCRLVFAPSRPTHRFCTARCRDLAAYRERRRPARRLRAATMQARPCRVCGNPIGPASAAYCAACRASGRATRDATLRSLYNVTLDGYEAMRRAQGDRCAIDRCERGAEQLDHDHSCCKGARSCGCCLRAFLCGPHNKALGMIEDSAHDAVALAAYLLRWPSAGVHPSRRVATS